MFNTHPIREPPQGKGGADEVMELAGAVIGRGVVINVIVNVALVDVSTDEKLILSLCPAHGRFIADFVGVLGRDLALGKRLADLKEQSAALHGPACFGLILAFREKKLGVSRCGIAEVRGQGPQLFRVEPIPPPLLRSSRGRGQAFPAAGQDLSLTAPARFRPRCPGLPRFLFSPCVYLHF